MPLPQTEMLGRLQARLAQRGIRMTSPRRAIWGVIETANKHLDASQSLRTAQKSDPSVERSIVNRTLGLLKRHGLIDELDLMHLNGEKHYYERKLGQDHIHMACLRCGKKTAFWDITRIAAHQETSPTRLPKTGSLPGRPDTSPRTKFFGNHRTLARKQLVIPLLL